MGDNHNSAPVIHVVAGALFCPDRGVLMCQRPEGKAHAGEWEFPGGKMEADERPEEALVRELAEEIGIIVDPVNLLPAGFASYAYPTSHVLLLLYVIKAWQGEPRSLENQAMQWVPVSELPTFAVLPADIPLVAHLPAYL
mgnify:CR=1 FL=1